jgi:hypothetical protein
MHCGLRDGRGSFSTPGGRRGQSSETWFAALLASAVIARFAPSSPADDADELPFEASHYAVRSSLECASRLDDWILMFQSADRA